MRGQTLKQPWILCGSNVPSERINEVEQAGARVVPVPLDSDGTFIATAMVNFITIRTAIGRIPPSSLPSILTSLGLRSVMIEGGSRVLSSFLHTLKRDDGSKLVDTVVVTVAPTFIGEGVGVVPEASFKDSSMCSHSKTFCNRARTGAYQHSKLYIQRRWARTLSWSVQWTLNNHSLATPCKMVSLRAAVLYIYTCKQVTKIHQSIKVFLYKGP